MLQRLLRKNKYAKDITHCITSAFILDNFFSTFYALRLILGLQLSPDLRYLYVKWFSDWLNDILTSHQGSFNPVSYTLHSEWTTINLNYKTTLNRCLCWQKNSHSIIIDISLVNITFFVKFYFLKNANANKTVSSFWFAKWI